MAVFAALAAAAVLVIVYLLIFVRNIGGVRLELWHAMGIGAALSLALGLITPEQAVYAVNYHIILYLLGMFFIGAALNESGLLRDYLLKVVKGSSSLRSFYFKLIIYVGITSALLMNDTLAVMLTPALISISRELGVDDRPLLVALAFSVTVGSVMSPIGNPQNLIIALSMPNPFYYFILYLAVPTLINLTITYFALSYTFLGRIRSKPNAEALRASAGEKTRLYRLATVSLYLLVGLSFLQFASFAAFKESFPVSIIAIVAAVPLFFSGRVKSLIRGVDWRTILFFIFMFITMQAVYNSGLLQTFLPDEINGSLQIMAIGVLLSQVLSNVPFVDLFIRLVKPTIANYVALAAGSTLAGNFMVLGAASNIIIIQNAERLNGHPPTAMDFLKLGVPLTIINVLVYWAFITLITGPL